MQNAAHFTLSIDLTDHVHSHSPMAHRHTIANMLNLARQQVASGHAMQGDLVHDQQKIGSWTLSEDSASAAA